MALILILSPPNNHKELLERELRFEEGTKQKLGRASSTESKRLSPASDNGWISCPVMSRDHALIECRLVDEKLKLYIRDLDSSHGTRLNLKNIHEENELQSGDVLEFGVVVNRGEETFYPPKFTVTIENAPSLVTHSIDKPTTVRKASTGVYSVPESDESDEYPDDRSEDDEMNMSPSPTSESLPTGGSTKNKDTAKAELEATAGASQTSAIVIDDDIQEDSEHDEIRIIPDTAPTQSQLTEKSDEEKKAPLPAEIETQQRPFTPSSGAVFDTYDTDHDYSDVCVSLYSESEIDESDDDIDDGMASGTKFGVPIDNAHPPPSSGLNPPLDLAQCFPSLLDEPAVQSVNLNRYQTGPFSCDHGSYTGGFYDNRPYQYYSQSIGYCSQFEPNREENITSSTFRQTQEALRKGSVAKPAELHAPIAKSPLSKSMSIENIINSESSLNKKRKFDDSMDIPDGQPPEIQRVADESSNPTTSRLSEQANFGEIFLDETELCLPRGISTEAEKTPEEIEKDTKEEAETPVIAAAAAPVLESAQRPQKKPKTGFVHGFFAGTAVGAVVGSIGVFAGLATIPEGFFTT